MWGQRNKFINNNDIDGSCPNSSKLHLNKSGTAPLVTNFSQALESDSHVPENFRQIKIFPIPVWKNTIICLFDV